MRTPYRPDHIVFAMLAGWLKQKQEKVIAYLREENRKLREQLGGRQPRFTDLQRARLATKAQALRHAVLDECATLVTPDSLRRWYRKLVALRYDGSGKRRPGRPRKPEAVWQLVIRLASENLAWGYTRNPRRDAALGA